MNLEDKKLLNVVVDKNDFEAIVNGERKVERLDYNKYWKEKLVYPCGTFKKYDLVSIRYENPKSDDQILVSFAGINIVKEKKSWFKTEKFFVIELGNVIKK